MIKNKYPSELDFGSTSTIGLVLLISFSVIVAMSIAVMTMETVSSTYPDAEIYYEERFNETNSRFNVNIETQELENSNRIIVSNGLEKHVMKGTESIQFSAKRGKIVYITSVHGERKIIIHKQVVGKYWDYSSGSYKCPGKSGESSFRKGVPFDDSDICPGNAERNKSKK